MNFLRDVGKKYTVSQGRSLFGVFELQSLDKFGVLVLRLQQQFEEQPISPVERYRSMEKYNRTGRANGAIFPIVLAVGALVFATLLQAASEQPIPSNSQASAPQQQGTDKQPSSPSQPNGVVGKSIVVTGTILKNGADLVLKDSAGRVYRLDAPDKAGPFEGMSVKVTGKLDAEANLLHVEAIEVMNA